MPYLAQPYNTIPYQAIPHNAILYHTVPYQVMPFFFFTHIYFPASGQAMVIVVVPSPPRFLPSIFIAHRVQRFHCSSIFHRVLLTHPLALSASQFAHKKKSPRIYTSMHSWGFELTKLTYTRLEDNLMRHRGDRTDLYYANDLHTPCVYFSSRAAATFATAKSCFCLPANHAHPPAANLLRHRGTGNVAEFRVQRSRGGYGSDARRVRPHPRKVQPVAWRERRRKTFPSDHVRHQSGRSHDHRLLLYHRCPQTLFAIATSDRAGFITFERQGRVLLPKGGVTEWRHETGLEVGVAKHPVLEAAVHSFPYIVGCRSSLSVAIVASSVVRL